MTLDSVLGVCLVAGSIYNVVIGVQIRIGIGDERITGLSKIDLYEKAKYDTDKARSIQSILYFLSAFGSFSLGAMCLFSWFDISKKFQLAILIIGIILTIAPLTKASLRLSRKRISGKKY